MGKHDSGYARVDKDLYQTLSPWVVDALAEHIEIRGKTIWEPAAGDGYLSDRLLAAGARLVYETDRFHYAGLDEQIDFLSLADPKLNSFHAIITNPPYGVRNTKAVSFAEFGLKRLRKKRFGLLALLLQVDFDSVSELADEMLQSLLRQNTDGNPSYLAAVRNELQRRSAEGTA